MEYQCTVGTYPVQGITNYRRFKVERGTFTLVPRALTLIYIRITVITNLLTYKRDS